MIRIPYPNLARNEKHRAWAEDHLPTMILRARHEKRTMDDRNLHFWKVWNVELDDQAFVGDQARVYIAAGRKALETWVINLQSGIYPTSEWFGLDYVEGVGTSKSADRWLHTQRQFINQMELRRLMPIGLRQYTTYGSMVGRPSWVEDYQTRRFFERVDARSSSRSTKERKVLRKEKMPKRPTNLSNLTEDEVLDMYLHDGTRIELVEREVPNYVGPRMRFSDIFHVYVSPMTSPDAQRAELVFEDIETTIEDVRSMADEYMDSMHPELGYVFENVDEFDDDRGDFRLPTDVLRVRQERMDRIGLVFDPNEEFGDMPNGHLNYSEGFWRGEVPNARDPISGEEYGVRDWKIGLINDTWVVHLSPNPHENGKRNFIFAHMLQVVDEFWGRGVTEAFASLQYMLNDIGNLTMENIIKTLNPIILINEDLVTNMDSIQVAPLAKWWVDPKGVEFVAPPNVAQVGMATLNMITGLVQDSSGANFVHSGEPAPRGRGRAQNTALGMSMIGAAGAKGFDFSLVTVEDQFMIPILEWNYDLAQQFMSDKIALLMAGGEEGVLIEEMVGFEDVFGKYKYRWLGSQGVREQQQLMQGLQGFIQMALQVRSVDPQAMASMRVKWPLVFKDMLSKGIGLPYASRWIETPEDTPPVDPEIENEQLLAHRPVRVSPAEDKMLHIQSHIGRLDNDPRFAADPYARKELEAHIKDTAMALQQEMAAQQMMAMQAAGGGQPGMGGGPPGMGGAPGGAPQPGNPAEAQADMSRSATQGGMPLAG